MSDQELPPTKQEMIVAAMQGLDTALEFLAEIEGPHAVAMAHFVHAALTYGEEFLQKKMS